MTQRPPADLRLPILAASAWSSAIATAALPAGAQISLVVLGLVGSVVAVRRSSRGRVRRTTVAVAVLALTVAIGVALRAAVVHESWVAVMTRDRAIAQLVVEVDAEPKVRPGREEDRATVRATVVAIVARGSRSTSRVAVLLALPADDASTLRVGATYAVTARLEQSLLPAAAAIAVATSRPVLVHPPGPSDRLAADVRDAILKASVGQTRAAGLVPALVDGDERALPGGVEDDFQTAGMTHMLAVSGTNFVLLGSAWMGIARWCGIRGRAVVPVGLAGIVALAVLARAEPSVLRAALMGAVALVGLGQGTRHQGVRALSACVCGVMLFDPGLALSPGFALSALASGGILLLAGPWRDALSGWMPRLLAEPFAVTLAAYVACLPLVVALSGRLSLVAIPANLVAGVAVGPATVLGFLGGIVGLLAPGLGRVVAAPAAWCASWIVGVAHLAAGLRHADVSVGSGVVLTCCLIAVSLLLAVALGWVLRRPLVAIPVLVGSMVASVISLPGGDWPPPHWVLVACDVGQGDGLVVNLGAGRALVVDTGPDPSAMRRCLRDLKISSVPILYLTHFHADHVNGVAAVLESTKVGVIEVTDLAEPPARVAFVQRSAAAAHVPLRTARAGEQGAEGELRWQVLAPLAPPPAASDSPPNDASVVILLEVRGARILLSGDEETGSQELLAQAYPSLKVDVLKVAHHGSAKQDPDLIRRLGARYAVISVGKGNEYGLPKQSTLSLLQRAGMEVHRTDQEGAVAVVVGDRGDVAVIARG